MATTDQQMQLKDAMARAKQIAAKLQQQQHVPPEQESRKRSMGDQGQPFYEEQNEPQTKRMSLGPGTGVDHTDPKVIAQQVANSLVQSSFRAGFGSMLVEEVMIPNKLVGLVIGRGGEMINKLQSESGAKIQVAPDPPPDMGGNIPDRQITITGMSDAVNKAKELIDEIKLEGKVPERLLAGAGGGPGEYSTEIQIPSTKVGLVIGKGGETIKSLQERAGCKMVLFQDGEFQNAPEKPLRISGEQSKVMYGKQLVSDLITQKELEAMGQDKFDQGQQGGQIGPNYDEVQVPRDAVGFVIGSKGASINNIQQMTGCKVQFKNDVEEGEFKVAMLSGNPQQVQMAKAKLMEILQSHQERKAGGGGGKGWGNRGAGGGNWNGSEGGNTGPRWGGNQGGRSFQRSGGFNRNQPLPPGHKHMLVDVPANKCGLVIGKGGETLKFIHQDTKVDIEISRDVPQDSPVRTFHLKGNDDMIEHALSVIRDKINDQSIYAKAYDGPPLGSSGGTGSSGGGGSGGNWNNQGGPGGAPGGWGGNNQGQWNQNQQWQQGGWGQPQQQQWGQGGWNPQQGWNQGQQGGWDQNQQQQWGQYQWAQQAGQQPAASSASESSSSTATTTTTATTNPASGQADYSAAWALYYQQQQQYYQQYNMQGGAAGAAASTATPAASTATATTAAASGDQNQAMADYQAKLAEYYKSYGQQPPQQDANPPPQ